MTSPPRLLFVAPALGSNEGWVTSQAEIVAERFQRDGYPTLLTSRRTGRLSRLADTVGSIVRWRSRYDLAVVAVFSWKAFAVADVVTVVLRLLRKPTVLVLHGGDLPRFTRRFPGWSARVLRRGTVVVSPSRYLESELGHLGIGMEVISNVIDLDDYPYHRRSPARPRLLWMRTFHPIYHPEMAVRVLAELRGRGLDATLTMGGQDRGLVGAVETLAGELGVDRWFTHAGFLDAPTKRSALADHDVFLNTNRVDNMPVSVLEAAAAGLVVVATAVGGIPYMLEDRRSALLVSDGDVEAMADAVEVVLRDPALATQLSDGARQVAEAATWPSVRDRYDAVFLDVLGQRVA